MHVVVAFSVAGQVLGVVHGADVILV